MIASLPHRNETASRGSVSGSISIVHPHAKGRAGRPILDPDPATVRFDGELAEGETQAAVAARRRLAPRLREALEDARVLARGDAGAGVLNAELDATPNDARGDPHVGVFGVA